VVVGAVVVVDAMGTHAATPKANGAIAAPTSRTVPFLMVHTPSV